MEETKKGSAMSVERWHTLAENGAVLPVRIKVVGRSMEPLIRKNRDDITILPVSRPLQRGDVVLFCDAAHDRYVVHRIWEMDEDIVCTWGDNCPCPDGWMERKQIWGVVTRVERGKKTVDLCTEAAREQGIRKAGHTHRRANIRERVIRIAGKFPEPMKEKLKALRDRFL